MEEALLDGYLARRSMRQYIQAGLPAKQPRASRHVTGRYYDVCRWEQRKNSTGERAIQNWSLTWYY